MIIQLKVMFSRKEMVSISTYNANSKEFLLCTDDCYFSFNCLVQFQKQKINKQTKQTKNTYPQSVQCSDSSVVGPALLVVAEGAAPPLGPRPVSEHGTGEMLL